MARSQPDGYISLPASARLGAVLVLHPWWGLNATLRATCDRLAQVGYVTFAPDLYHGKVATEIAEAEALAGALDRNADQAKAEIDDGVAFLRTQAPSTTSGIAVIGFSLGAYYALDLSARAESVRSVVLYYGTGPADFSRARSAYLGHFAENDPYEPDTNVRWLEGALAGAGRPFTVYRYPETGHWFAEPDRADAYRAEAARLAWDRTLAFLQQTQQR